MYCKAQLCILYTVLSCIVLYCTALHCIVLYYIVWYGIVLHWINPYQLFCIFVKSSVLVVTLLYWIIFTRWYWICSVFVLHCIVSYFTVLYHTSLYCTFCTVFIVMHHNVLYTVLYCNILHKRIILHV